MRLEDFLREFREIVGTEIELPEDLAEQAKSIISGLPGIPALGAAERRTALLAHINEKLRLNRDRTASTYAAAAERGITFNYLEKRAIEEAFDYADEPRFRQLLGSKAVPAEARDAILATFNPVSEAETLRHFERECRETVNPRLKKVDPSMTQGMLLSVFAAYVFSSFGPREMHRRLDPLPDEDYESSFWRRLHLHNEKLFERDNALWIVSLDQEALGAAGGFRDLRNQACSMVAGAYRRLNNHCFLAVIIHPLRDGPRFVSWEMAADLVLFGEKFVEEELQKAYFQHEKIAAVTAGYIRGLSVSEARFELAHGGFAYQDCFVLMPSPEPGGGEPTLVLLMQKHQRDETPIPCPACRSHSVQGNSYPTIGVKSWECQNFICPDRSKSNRGKRYSFLSLLKQQALEDPENAVPPASVRAWMRDVRLGASVPEVLDMLVRHYSLSGDVVRTFNIKSTTASIANRTIVAEALPSAAEDGLFEAFQLSPFFARFMVEHPSERTSDEVRELGDPDFRVLLGDAYAALKRLPADSVDGAVTSPPYYNAREYSQWPNIYCYLYDMYNIARETYRVLKPGALYLFNIFDYFDNENAISLSAMGEKRMILSAYTNFMFREIGFEPWGNVVWDKGDIEGKRGFNGGNFSPYYQSPFNCWEHVLIFAKPGAGVAEKVRRIPHYLRQKPVFKMVNGSNRHGHTAPFPEAIPELLLATMDRGETVLDPFAGSLTTARAAERMGLRSISVELSADYCELGLSKRREQQAQGALL